MLEPHKIAPPPRGVKHSVPSPGNDTRRETSDFYSQVIAVLAPRWRVVTCRNDIQWILQKRTAEPLHEGIWRGQSYCTSRDALLEVCASRELLFDRKARALLNASPDLISQNSKWIAHGAEDCLIEVRCPGENKNPLIQKFSYNKIPDAVKFAKVRDNQKYNIYATINPINPNVERNARDEDVSLAFFSFADADDLTGVDALKKFCDIHKPEFTVITGRTPHLRFHVYWRLLKPCSNVALWRETQEQIALNFHTDTVVKNPSRIMRVSGTVSYPNCKKRAQGYIDELVVLKINSNPHPFADISSWSNVLLKPVHSETFDIDLGKNSLDINALKEAVSSEQNWHDNMLRLVGRLVADGLQKEEILNRAAEFTSLDIQSSKHAVSWLR